MRRVIGGAIYGLSTVLGLVALLYPFILRSAWAASQGARAQDAPLVTATLVGLSLLALLVELQGETIGAKTVAMLGVLVAIASVLRFLETLVPLPGGFSPIFAPILLAGYVFGARFGFLMGVFTILTSALVTGGVGPWLPYQMLTAGWVGMSAGWLRALGLPGAREGRLGRVEHALLSAAGFSWGLLFGAITNLYFWPYAQGPVSQTWSAGLSLGETLARFGAFYAATSLPWDMARAVGNVALLLPLAVPTVRALTRFRRRFRFQAGPPGAIEGVRADA